MSERKCPACGENLEKNESVCPICELSGLDQVFLTKEAYERWKRDVLEKHLCRIVKVKIWYKRKESDEIFTFGTLGTLLFCKNNGRTFAVLRPKEKGNTYRINRLTRLGKIRNDHIYCKMTITSDAGEFLMQNRRHMTITSVAEELVLPKWFVGIQELRAARDLLKQLLPPFKGPHHASCLRQKWCNGGEYDCTEKMAVQEIRMRHELMRSHYLKWLQNRQSFREKWFVLTAPYTLLHTQNGTKAIFQTQGRESIPVNQTSIEILEILQEGAFFQDIVCELEERYCAEPEQIQDAVASYLHELLELRICKFELREECKE